MRAALRRAGFALAVLFAGFVYCFALDSQHIPKNGDENPYAHVTRVTAASGHWLPLRADIGTLRNTKPPLLFWQGIASTGWGSRWTLWNLRLPSVIYTLLSAALVFLLARRMAGDAATGLLGALCYLAFFTTYRYGRPFLTDAPETFWLFLCWFIPLYWPGFARTSRWAPPLLGLLAGIGMLYKSFALLLPVGLALAWWHLHRRDYRLRECLRADALRLLVVAVVALGLFALWFALDPDPAAIWREFVTQENAGKFAAGEGSYLASLLWGGSSVWTMLLGMPVNAGLLALPVAALMLAALRDRRALDPGERELWIWLLAMMLAFTLPSQRSARYLLPAMPALAVLCALGWRRLHRGWFIASLALCALVIGVLAWQSWLLDHGATGGGLYPAWYWALLLAALVLCVSAIRRPAWTRPATPVAALAACLVLAAFLGPFDGPRGNFAPGVAQRVAGREVWVPSDFVASQEAYVFRLPGAVLHSYDATAAASPDELARRYPLFAVRGPLEAVPCAGCRLLGERLELRGRLSNTDVRALLAGRVYETLFMKELLLESPAPQPQAAGGR